MRELVSLIAVLLLAALALGLSSAEPLMGPKPDYTKLALKGDGVKQDHFSLTVQAAARLLGREADYETVYALSTNAFAPCIDPEETCTSWWSTATGRDACLDTVAARLGLGVRKLPDPDHSSDPAMPDEGPERDRWFRDYHRKPLVPAVTGAQERGEVVITCREWQVRGPHGFNPWCWWGIVVDAREDGTVLGASLNGHTDNPFLFLADLAAVSPTQPTLSPREADLEMLRRAVHRIRGDAPPFVADDRTVYGLEAMDLWIKQMETVPGFCAECQERSQKGWTDAADNGTIMEAGAKVAASYLRKRLATFPEAARPYIERAAERYERIRELLRPALTGEGGETYKQFIANPAKQKAHAENVLRPIRAELEAAGGDMQRALNAAYPPSAFLDDVPAGKPASVEFAQGLAIALSCAGTPTEYETLMGDLGTAFIMQASNEGPLIDGALDAGWWPLEPVALPTYLDFVQQAVGRRIRYIAGDITVYRADPRQHYSERLATDVKASLAAKRPALGIGSFWKLITGYDQEEHPLLGHCPSARDRETERLEQYPWAVVTVGSEIGRLDRNVADLEALRHAVELANDSVSLPDGYRTGQKAFAVWVKALRDTEHLGQARWHANVCLHLRLNRRAAVTYVSAMADRHTQPVASHLRAAAGRYERVLTQLNDVDTSHEAMMSKDGRETLAQLAEAIAATEAEAVAEIEKALAAAG